MTREYATSATTYLIYTCPCCRYVIVENLRSMLLPYSPDEPLQLGFQMQPFLDMYMSGGAGYVLSREAVRCLVTRALLQGGRCEPLGHAGAEDENIGKPCLMSLIRHSRE